MSSSSKTRREPSEIIGCIHCANAIEGSEALANGFGTWLNGDGFTMNLVELVGEDST
ncbi:hypothetical protein PC116_g25345 [Phytophthora cactorum]|nr:hypothetical protein PC116_g25345 [Phytophthora cactorum]